MHKYQKLFTFAICPLLSASLILSYAPLVQTAEPTNQQQANLASEEINETNSQEESKKQPKIPFAVSNEQLSENNHADETLWLEVDEKKILVLKLRAKGTVQRGNLILLHALGENPTHNRLVSPLSQQFSQLGWQVYIPNIPLEKYPEKLTEIAEVSTSSTLKTNSESKTNNQTANTTQNNQQEDKIVATENSQESAQKSPSFFSSEESYQNHFNQIIETLIQKIQPISNNLVIVANKESAFRILNITNSNSAITHVVLLHPQMHTFDELILEERIKLQKLPVFALFNEPIKRNPFYKSFEKKLWPSNQIRIFENLYAPNQIHLENDRYSKMITGWVTPKKH